MTSLAILSIAMINMTTPAQDAAPELRNRLGEETSPYLLQHAGNPVHWQPWGPEAFAIARRLDRPIFLSIGYSTCYWCHVMERESFENDEIAAIMNEHFVCIKVDREERPDVDDVYMSAVQLLNQGQGGWPMSVWIEPATLKPFLGGTYFPAVEHPGRAAFPSVLAQIDELWRTRRADVLRQADHVAEAVSERLSLEVVPTALDESTVETAVLQLMSSYDPAHGGFGRGPNKFPVPANLDFLIAAGWDRADVRAAVEHTLDRMALGGMYDQVGGGFHRYSTDPKWLVPHFEKMLYDNGQLASTYAEAARRADDPFYARVVREILEYVLREMTEPHGAFRSAQDAEVNHLEGGNYLWVPDDVRRVLTEAGMAQDIDFALELYGLSAGTNFVDPHHPEAGRKNVLFLAARAEDWERVDRIDAVLLKARDLRDQPLTDDKVLTAWNGLMIAGFADGGTLLQDDRYLDAGRRAARWLLEHHRAADGGLLRTSRHGAARIDAFLEDYAYLAHGLIALARTGEDDWALQAARELVDAARERFWDSANGGWFDTMENQADLFVRVKSHYDGATPSGSGVMLDNLLSLEQLTGDPAYLDDAVAGLRALSRDLAAGPAGAVLSANALHRVLPRAGDRLRGGAAPVGPVVTVEPDAVTLDAGGIADVRLRIAAGPGLHVTAHDAGLDGVLPLEVVVTRPDDWTIDVRYPESETFDGPVGSMRVYHDAIEISVTIRRRVPGAAAPVLAVRYQMCSESACMLPETVSLPVSIVP